MIGLEPEEEWQLLESEAKKADHTRFRFRQRSDSRPTGCDPKMNAATGDYQRRSLYILGSHGRAVAL
jgi:hypothetical protein